MASAFAHSTRPCPDLVATVLERDVAVTRQLLRRSLLLPWLGAALALSGCREPLVRVSASPQPTSTVSSASGSTAPSQPGRADGTGDRIVSGAPAPQTTGQKPVPAGNDETLGWAPLGVDGKPLLPPAEPRLAFGTSGCTPSSHPGATCAAPALPAHAKCDLFELRRCGERTEAYRSTRMDCVEGRWSVVSSTDPTCPTEPRSPLPALEGCSIELSRVLPSELSPTDGCQLALRCADVDFVVECDGENDGAVASLCACWRNRETATLPKVLYGGEAQEPCARAAVDCVGRP